MTVEIISWSTSKEELIRAGVELATPGSAVPFAIDWATWYVVGTQKNGLNEAALLSSKNKC